MASTIPRAQVISSILALCLLCLILLAGYQLVQASDDDQKDSTTRKPPDRSAFRQQATIKKQQQEQPKASDSSQQQPSIVRKEFRIGVIVPRTAFLSQYKTYTQRIKDTFNQMLQLSRHQQVKRKQTAQQNSHSSVPMFPFQATTLAAQTVGSTSSQHSVQADPKLPTSSCQSNSRALPSSSSSHHHLNHQQLHHHKQLLPWPNLIFNQYFDTKVVDLVNLTARSSVQEIIDSMCRGLIEQNVSVIVYLENNQDQTVSSSLDSVASGAVQTVASMAEPKSLSIAELEASRSTMPSKPEQTVQKLQNNETSSLRAGRWSSSEVQQASSQAHFIMHLAHSAGIPMIAWSVTATLAQRPKRQRTLHLAPTVAHEAKAMLAILERYSWHSFSVVSTTLAGHDDFILAIRQLIAASNSGPQQNLSSSPTAFGAPATSDSGQRQEPGLLSASSHFVPRQQEQEQISAQPSRP